MIRNERQVADTVDGIRADHRFRYEWAAGILEKGNVTDAASGIGYGSFILAESGFNVNSIEVDLEAVEYGDKHYSHPNIKRICQDLYETTFDGHPVVMFECIEHIERPEDVLNNIYGTLLASVPNESVVPYNINNKFHYRHYTKPEFEQLLHDCGFEVTGWYGQETIFSDVETEIEGQTLIATAEKR